MELTGPMILQLRTALVETQDVFAKRFGVSGRSVGHWEQGRPPSQVSNEKLVRLYKKTLPSHVVPPETALEGLTAEVVTDTTPSREPFKISSVSAKGGRHALKVAHVHEAIAEFNELVAKDHLDKAITYVAQKYNMPRVQLRASTALLLYLVDEMKPPMTLKTLLKALSGHEDPG